MNDTSGNDPQQEMQDWWRTAIIDMEPGAIRYRGYAIEELIGNVSFTQMIWLMTRGELPGRAQAKLLDAALMSAVDHGPQAPSIAIARMAATCGVGLNNAMASAVNALGDVHGGAGEQAIELYRSIAGRIDGGASMADATAAQIDDFTATQSEYLPGFGHRFHPIDPRAPRLLELVDNAARDGAVSGRFAKIGRAIEAALKRRKGKTIPMNIDGVSPLPWHAACSACPDRSEYWPMPGNRPNRAAATRGQSRAIISGPTTDPHNASCRTTADSRARAFNGFTEPLCWALSAFHGPLPTGQEILTLETIQVNQKTGTQMYGV
jgi:citrate synthase